MNINIPGMVSYKIIKYNILCNNKHFCKNLCQNAHTGTKPPPPSDYMLNRKEVCHLLGLTANTKTLAGWNVTRYVTADLYNPSSQYSLELEVCEFSI